MIRSGFHTERHGQDSLAVWHRLVYLIGVVNSMKLLGAIGEGSPCMILDPCKQSLSLVSTS